VLFAYCVTVLKIFMVFRGRMEVISHTVLSDIHSPYLHDGISLSFTALLSACEFLRL